jgi:hypothetical protein
MPVRSVPQNQNFGVASIVSWYLAFQTKAQQDCLMVHFRSLEREMQRVALERPRDQWLFLNMYTDVTANETSQL